MDKEKERDIIHKILDNDAGEEEKQIIERGRRTDPALREEVDGLTRAVRLLEESERREPPAFFTAEVMKKLPARKPTVAGRISSRR
jgi:hypothetical protein